MGFDIARRPLAANESGSVLMADAGDLGDVADGVAVACCGLDEFAQLMKAVRADLWGPGVVMSETDYLAITLGRTPSRDEVEALIGRVPRVQQPCHEAWCESADYRALQRIHLGPQLKVQLVEKQVRS
jgi:hypothetical protein